MRSLLLILLVLLAPALPAPFARADEPFQLVAEDDWFPYSGERNNVAEGMAVDLVRAAYDAAGHQVTFISQPYARCLEEVEQGLQLGCFDTTREPENEARFLFHKVPLFAARIVIIAPVDSAAADLVAGDLQGERVAVTNGYTYGEPFQSDATVDKDVVTSDLAVLRLVALRRASYGVIYDRVMASLIAENAGELGGKVKVVGLLAEPELYVSFSKQRPEAAEAMAALDRGIALIKANGTYAAIEERWAARFSVAGSL
ncbi:MAG: transporter substrate-binding domain-containing protein [Rhodospirillaceae bacterium]|nr:transporter substrate-binding domain-containing protein [Rhodospirillaceae bacterium]